MQEQIVDNNVNIENKEKNNSYIAINNFIE